MDHIGLAVGERMLLSAALLKANCRHAGSML
jgi:hypothetical protein